MKEQNTKPPRVATRLLRVFIRHDLVEDVVGDLQEQFDYALKTGSPFRARLDYWYQVIHYLRPFAIRKSASYSNPYPMYKSYFKTALRGMLKNRIHAFINIAGLSVGMAVVIIIGLWIKDELSFEKQFKNYDRVGQIIQHVTNNGEIDTWRSIPFPLADEIRKNYGSDFSQVVLTTEMNSELLETETVKLNKSGIFAEPGFASLFSLDMVRGTRDATKDPSSILLSESTAKSYFGDTDPIGKVMTIGSNLTVNVGGVYEDIPVNSVFHELNFIGAWDLLYNQPNSWFKNMDDPWRPNAFTLYVQLADKATFIGASTKIKDAKLKKVSEALAKKKPTLFVHPMTDWHLYGKFTNGKQAGGRIQYVWMFGIIGSFVLLMACINFMNLSTARSEKRAREVGIRKAVGSLRGQLIAQFFSESVLTAFLSMILGLLLSQLSLSWFNLMADKQMTLPWSSVQLWLGGLAFIIVIGLIAGSYPALYLSSIKSNNALKGTFKAGRFATLPRKILVIVQFTVSVTLIIGTSIVFMQIRYAADRPIGYETNGLISVPVQSDEVHRHFDAIRSGLIDNGSITSMAEAAAPTTEQWSTSSRFEWDGKDPDLSVDFPTFGVSHDYGKTIGWEIVAGRDFSRDFVSDTTALIINEAAVRFMDFKNPVGEVIRWASQPLTVVGVIKDIVVRSPYEVVKPTIYFLSGREHILIIRINPTAPASASIAEIESTIKKYDADEPFSYQFMDEQYARKFNNEERVAQLASVFAVLAIFISCLGTFGLSSFVAEQRTKEIGVRKIMGASMYQLWSLMSRDFLSLVVISCIIAVPVAYVLLSNWLLGYHYHTTMPWWLFAGASGVTLLITLLASSWHTLQAAWVNPVKSLRSE